MPSRNMLNRGLLGLISNDHRVIKYFENLRQQAHDDLPRLIDGQNAELNATKTDVNTRIDGLQTLTDSLTSRVSTNETEINSVKQADIALSIRTTAVESDIADIKTTINAINTSISDLQGQITTINNQLAGIESRLTTAESKLPP